MKITVRYISGIGGDRVEVEVLDNDGNKIKDKTYTYGCNASYCRRHEEYAKRDHENAIKYNWGAGYPLMPYIGDLLVNLFAEYEMTKDDTNVEYSGYYVFPQREATSEEVAKIKQELFEEL